LVELGECAAPASLPEPTDARSTGDTVTSFQVVALVRLRVASGHLVAAATNTGCAPRPTDTFLIGDRAATEAETAAALASFRSGDWRAPGAWHDAD
jgi:hypothetical protein